MESKYDLGFLILQARKGNLEAQTTLSLLRMEFKKERDKVLKGFENRKELESEFNILSIM
ncbi:hypothetical protein [Helicobacter sp.]|uniref:hypothetical protein n=1 Tax=Helicobacter sp. TaxID=218 RepID=UPI0025BF783E|nr:hypothetical protein [Helicobacter sp.]MCI5968331.1 hypothetical protein [Helicobacter sp.]MDY2584860.1 hypothetical protein [Helicobacter sp.]